MIANHSQEIIEYAKEFNYQIVECLNYGDIHTLTMCNTVACITELQNN